MSYQECCIKGFKWSGTPTGKISKLNDNDVYIAGDNPDVAVMIIHDVLGWTFPNARLLADHFANEINATVYLPDFFAGEIVDPVPITAGDFSKFDVVGFAKRQAREIREPEIFAAAKTLKAKYKKVGAIGYCFGGWAVFRLGAKEHNPPLIDAISTGHPSLMTKKDIEEVAVPTQLLAPEHDPQFTPELKAYILETFPKLGIEWDYRHFPGVEHGCMVRGNEKKPGERAAMGRAKDSAVSWFNQFLHEY
ncbi:dienelactone hydrolase family protein [Annulohypoxylon truncatum]|uniref:dienelactone hydrolase family protein n=1 Tax=Annulohypoxylon truncatum TaxID=327061 RepID=UPI0020079BDE|nr:dienelactone hydrolase family protein [Annulohypoxylon truncatum]KAI1215179.1 dienelactone hydrolase family protein [Annulohypoxylon truncatum]